MDKSQELKVKPRVIMIDDKGQKHEYSQYILVGVEKVREDGMNMQSIIAVDGHISVIKGFLESLAEVHKTLRVHAVNQMAMEALKPLHDMLSGARKEGRVVNIPGVGTGIMMSGNDLHEMLNHSHQQGKHSRRRNR